MTADSSRRVRTTVDLPAKLRQRMRQALDEGVAASQNALIVHALEHYLQRLTEARIDAEFAQMMDDEQYQVLHLQIASEFAGADWEAFQLQEDSNEAG